jgi:phosphoglycolate phosphatase
MLEVLRPIPSHQLRLLVFDLDGTLIDSRQDLANAVNAMLRALGRGTLPDAVIASYIGDGAGMLVRRALGDPSQPGAVEQALELFLNFYSEHKLDHTCVYGGVFASLDALRVRVDGHRCAMAVLTNKPVNPSREICAALGLAPYFTTIYGGNSFATKKPDPEGLLQLMREANARPEETLMVGDSDVDVLTARAAGAWSLGCRYGLSPHSIEAMRDDNLVDAVVDTPADWPAALGLVHAAL